MAAADLPREYGTPLDAASNREAHQKLFSIWTNSGNAVIAISSQEQLHSRTTLVHLVFEDCIGSLGAICSALASRSISIIRVHATTAEGVAFDTVEVSSFDPISEGVLRVCLEKKLFDAKNKDKSTGELSGLPESYMHVTTPAERVAHSRMFADWLHNGRLGVKLMQTTVVDGDGADVLLHLVFRDVEGSLAVITAALAGCGVNVKRVAAFSTPHGPAAIDTFQLDSLPTDAERDVLEQLMAHLSEIEGSQHGGSIWS